VSAATTTVVALGSTGESVLFWVLAPVAVIAALGLVFARKAVHAALMLALDMVCLAILYIVQGAPFLGIVQVVVYTGAVMMLFLFVLMLVGVDSSDSMVETIRGQRWAALLAALGFGVLAVAIALHVTTDEPVGLAGANGDGNVQGIATLLFSKYVFAFEATSALLITAAVGAMVLTHRERHQRRLTQRELSEARVRSGRQVPPLPSPGVYARHNAVDTPALLPDGSIAEGSLSRVLAARGVRLDPAPLARVSRTVETLVEEGQPVIVSDTGPVDSDAPDEREGRTPR
jgi:NADH-quinone oxidoreductase subunit J